MPHRTSHSLFKSVLVPVVNDATPTAAVAAAQLLAESEELYLFGLVTVPEDQSLSFGAEKAQALRRALRKSLDSAHVRARVAHDAWQELKQVIGEERPELLVLEWPTAEESLGKSLDEIFERPPCDISVVRKPFKPPKHILVPMRGGPFSELALRHALAIAHDTGAKVSSLHIRTPQLTKKQDAAFEGIAQVLANLPEIEQHHVDTDDPAGTIIEFSRKADLVIMGASAHPKKANDPFGETAERVMQESPAGVIIVKTKRPMPEDDEIELAGQGAISVLVDKWFAENTYNAEEFSDLKKLRQLKEKQNLTISVAMPALNEEKTVGKVIRVIKESLVKEAGLLDEIVLIDSGSTDRTREIAAELGVPVYIHQDILPQYEARPGKGEALWKSLYVTKGDIVLWIDTDIKNINPRFLYGLVGPLLVQPHLQFVKGFYRRPLRVGNRVQASGGGRVTELTARPLINLFYPELSGVIQPLSGEYGGRRSALEQLPFFSGYGVETGLLIDVFENFGLAAIGQVNLQERIHHNQPLEALSLMSFAIIQVLIRRLEKRYGREFLEDVNKSMKLIRYADRRFFLEVEEIIEQERPPMITLTEYRGRTIGSTESSKQPTNV